MPDYASAGVANFLRAADSLSQHDLMKQQLAAQERDRAFKRRLALQRLQNQQPKQSLAEQYANHAGAMQDAQRKLAVLDQEITARGQVDPTSAEVTQLMEARRRQKNLLEGLELEKQVKFAAMKKRIDKGEPERVAKVKQTLPDGREVAYEIPVAELRQEQDAMALVPPDAMTGEPNPGLMRFAGLPARQQKAVYEGMHDGAQELLAPLMKEPVARSQAQPSPQIPLIQTERKIIPIPESQLKSKAQPGAVQLADSYKPR